MKRLRSFLFISIVAALIQSVAQAATITWSSGQITSSSDVLTTGKTVFALTLGSTTNSPAVIVNSIDFQNGSRSGASNDNKYEFAYTPAGGEKIVSFGMQKSGGTNGFTNDGSSAMTGSFLESDEKYNLLLQSAFGGSGGGGETIWKLFFSNLTIGNTYVVQLWTNAAHEKESLVTFNNGSDVSDSGSIQVSRGSNSPSTLGSWVTATFVADSADQTINMNGKDYMKLNAVQLRDLGPTIPEPTSAALFLLTGVCLFRRHRS